MGEVAQSIIVALIIVVAVVWAIKRIFFTRNKGCGCGKEGCDAPHQATCGDCPLAGKCGKK